MFVAVSFTVTTQGLIFRRVDKKVLVPLYSGLLLSQKNTEMSPFATARMDIESVMLSEINQPEKDKYHMILLICGI